MCWASVTSGTSDQWRVNAPWCQQRRWATNWIRFRWKGQIGELQRSANWGKKWIIYPTFGLSVGDLHWKSDSDMINYVLPWIEVKREKEKRSWLFQYLRASVTLDNRGDRNFRYYLRTQIELGVAWGSWACRSMSFAALEFWWALPGNGPEILSVPNRWSFRLVAVLTESFATTVSHFIIHLLDIASRFFESKWQFLLELPGLHPGFGFLPESVAEEDLVGSGLASVRFSFLFTLKPSDL